MTSSNAISRNTTSVTECLVTQYHNNATKETKKTESKSRAGCSNATCDNVYTWCIAPAKTSRRCCQILKNVDQNATRRARHAVKDVAHRFTLSDATTHNPDAAVVASNSAANR